MLSDWPLTCIVSSLNLQALTSLQNEPSYYFCLEVSHRLDDFLRVVESFLSPPCGQLTQTLFGKIWASRLSGVQWQARRLVTKAAFSCKQQPDGQGPCPKHSWLGLGVGREVLPASKYLLLYLHSNCSGHNETLKLHIKTWEVLQSQAWLGEGVPLDFPSALSLSLWAAFQLLSKGTKRQAIMLAAHSLMPAVTKDVCAETTKLPRTAFKRLTSDGVAWDSDTTYLLVWLWASHLQLQSPFRGRGGGAVGN